MGGSGVGNTGSGSNVSSDSVGSSGSGGKRKEAAVETVLMCSLVELYKAVVKKMKILRKIINRAG